MAEGEERLVTGVRMKEDVDVRDYIIGLYRVHLYTTYRSRMNDASHVFSLRYHTI